MRILEINQKEKYFIIGNDFYKHKVGFNESCKKIFTIHQNDKWFDDRTKSLIIKLYLDAKEHLIEKGLL